MKPRIERGQAWDFALSKMLVLPGMIAKGPHLFASDKSDSEGN